MKQKQSSFINIGFSSIVMVFIMICLVTFASLSVLTANSDYRLSKKMADKTTAYYNADSTAREIAEKVDQTLYGIYLNSSSAKEYYQKVSRAFTDFSDADIFVTPEGTALSYAIPVTEVQTLHVTLGVHYPLSQSEYFSTIERWQTITENAPEESDEYLNLFTGNE